jgi:hypothetical protein
MGISQVWSASLSVVLSRAVPADSSSVPHFWALCLQSSMTSEKERNAATKRFLNHHAHLLGFVSQYSLVFLAFVLGGIAQHLYRPISVTSRYCLPYPLANTPTIGPFIKNFLLVLLRVMVFEGLLRYEVCPTNFAFVSTHIYFAAFLSRSRFITLLRLGLFLR